MVSAACLEAPVVDNKIQRATEVEDDKKEHERKGKEGKHHLNASVGLVKDFSYVNILLSSLKTTSTTMTTFSALDVVERIDCRLFDVEDFFRL